MSLRWCRQRRRVAGMTRAEAEAEAARRNAKADAAGVWAAQRTPDDNWQVVHLVGGGIGRTRPTGAHVESKPKPTEPSDPRPAISPNIPPYGAARAPPTRIPPRGERGG